MRVGVDYRILAVGPELISRGMGRYTQQQLRAVLGADRANEYLLLANEGNDLSLIDPEVRNRENVDIALYSQARHLTRVPGKPEELLERGEHYQRWIAGLGLDVYHATTPFLLEPPLLFDFDACPMVATLYDLIPLLFPEHYFTDHPIRDDYLRTLGLLRRATRLISISDCASADAIARLGVDPERIDRAWPMVDAVFRPLPAHMLRKLLLSIRSRLRLPERYILTVSHPHHSKNLETLLEGYAALPALQRTETPLVVCCHFGEYGLRTVSAMTGRLGVGDDVVLTGLVSDEELCALYNQATVVVHPSRYEGFGLPVAEAMACATPVITTTTSSLPEVAGDAALLVDPEDPAAFTAALAGLLRDPAARQDLVERGLRQVRRFSAGQLVTATLACYARAAAAGPPAAGPPAAGTPVTPPTGSGPTTGAAPTRPRVAMWTPLPPQTGLVAEYGQALADELALACHLELFVGSGALPGIDVLARHRVAHGSALERRRAQAPFDAVIYQVAGPEVDPALAAAMVAEPGIVVLHDLAWIHSGAPDAWAALAASRDQIVLSEGAAAALRAACPGSAPLVIPVGGADPYRDNPVRERSLSRLELGLPPEALVVVCPAGPGSAQLAAGALAQLASAGPEVVMLVADEAGADRSAGLDGLRRVPAAQLEAALRAADIGLHPEDPLASEGLHALARSLAAGLPVVALDHEGWPAGYDEFCTRVPVRGSPGEQAVALGQALGKLAGDPQRRRAEGAAARACYEREGRIAPMTTRYLLAIDQLRTTHRTGSQPGLREMG